MTRCSTFYFNHDYLAITTITQMTIPQNVQSLLWWWTKVGKYPGNECTEVQNARRAVQILVMHTIRPCKLHQPHPQRMYMWARGIVSQATPLIIDYRMWLEKLTVAWCPFADTWRQSRARAEAGPFRCDTTSTLATYSAGASACARARQTWPKVTHTSPCLPCKLGIYHAHLIRSL